MDYKITVFLIFIGFAVVEMIAGKFANKKNSKKKDIYIEAISTSVILAFTVPAVFAATAWLGHYFFPQYKNALADLSWPVMLLLLMIGDDMVQYWWHRLCHTPWLYGLHRAHHSANYMSIRVVYRNNLFYYMVMPSLWVSGFLLYLGLFKIYPYYLITKLTIIYGAHSSMPWDKMLHSKSWLSPLGWIIERTISTPSTHHAHHGMYKEDGITNYKGNFGNMFFLWDVIFGTAHITRKYPEQYGIENLQESSWQQELLWPLVSKTSNKMK
ncbi:MAG TPA: fatty acid hydroxylase family protein [Aeromonadales bacterium]|nr:fatty acid hydroxylase family protein [Aeromonadales bacterium]